MARRLARTFTVTGVDLSPVQIERARRNVPEATFLCADMTRLEFSAGQFALITAFYAIIHVPLAEQPALLRSLYTWLRPGGPLRARMHPAAREHHSNSWFSVLWTVIDRWCVRNQSPRAGS